jgi:hypothetical protein
VAVQQSNEHVEKLKASGSAGHAFNIPSVGMCWVHTG